jgi:hypothetical protein
MNSATDHDLIHMCGTQPDVTLSRKMSHKNLLGVAGALRDISGTSFRRDENKQHANPLQRSGTSRDIAGHADTHAAGHTRTNPLRGCPVVPLCCPAFRFGVAVGNSINDDLVGWSRPSVGRRWPPRVWGVLRRQLADHRNTWASRFLAETNFFGPSPVAVDHKTVGAAYRGGPVKPKPAGEIPQAAPVSVWGGQA